MTTQTTKPTKPHAVSTDILDWWHNLPNNAKDQFMKGHTWPGNIPDRCYMMEEFYNAFLNECYKIGMSNGWCSGRYAMQDGDFITPEDRFNRNKFTVFTDIDKLEADFDHGNWCLGEAFVYNDLCFINQVDGGDEWLTIKRFETGARAFESITMKAYTKDGRFKDLIQRLEAAHMTEDDRVEY